MPPRSRNGSIIRAGDMTQLAPGLFLANAVAAADEALMGRAKVDTVINFADDLEKHGHRNLCAMYEHQTEDGAREASVASEFSVSDVHRLSYPMPDDPADDFDLLSFARPIIGKVLELKRDNRVVLHCVSGRNRSATIAVAVLMTEHRCTLRCALEWVVRCRPVVEPHAVYQRQLVALQHELCQPHSAALEALGVPESPAPQFELHLSQPPRTQKAPTRGAPPPKSGGRLQGARDDDDAPSSRRGGGRSRRGTVSLEGPGGDPNSSRRPSVASLRGEVPLRGWARLAALRHGVEARRAGAPSAAPGLLEGDDLALLTEVLSSSGSRLARAPLQPPLNRDEWPAGEAPVGWREAPNSSPRAEACVVS